MLLIWSAIIRAGQDCNRYQFECRNVDQPKKSECIAVYDACDGIVQCSDGSDEVYCHRQQGLFFILLIAFLFCFNSN